MPPKLTAHKIKKQVEQEQFRARVLALFRAGGLPLKQIADHPDVRKSKATVQSIIERFNDRETVQRKPGGGRPSKITQRCALHDFG